MAIVIEAVYEDGVLKPAVPLPLDDRQKVQITIQAENSPLLRSYGLMEWTGDAQTAERFACDPELDFPPTFDAGAALRATTRIG